MIKINLGADISKETIDFFCDANSELFQLKNNVKGLDKLLMWADQHQYPLNQIAIAFEHTGHYGNALVDFCVQHEITFYHVPALEIKKSLGITRGKNDQIDAKRICAYLKEKGYKLTPTKPVNDAIERLKHLQAQRALFVRNSASIKNVLKDQLEVLAISKEDFLVRTNMQMIQQFEKSIKEIDDEIQKMVEVDKEIKKNYNHVISITGIGKVIAIDTIIATHNFTKFNNWRQYASYCGCAPFEYSSGKFIGKPRISKLANKELKAHLNSGALSAIKFDNECKMYFERKLKEGKTKKCITNVIRCKLIARMYAVVKQNRPFEKNYAHSLEGKVS